MGDLVVVGTGMSAGQITAEAMRCIESADKLLYCVTDSVTEALLRERNSTAESLAGFYIEGGARSHTYHRMVQRIMRCVRQDMCVCVAFYGHPTMFVLPTRLAVRMAKNEGHGANILPGVSSLDCLLADLCVRASDGIQILEATELLLRRRAVDTSSILIVYQAGVVADSGFSYGRPAAAGLPRLVECLVSVYGPTQRVTVYEAARRPGQLFSEVIVPLVRLRPEIVTNASTLVVFPLSRTLEDDEEYGLLQDEADGAVEGRQGIE